MKKKEETPYKFKSIADAHREFGLPGPKHPLISLINGEQEGVTQIPSGTHVLNFYKISYKPNLRGRLRYGRDYYDFNEGGLIFAAPNQIMGKDVDQSVACEYSLFTLLVHPDFFIGHPIARQIKEYGFFSYSANEALHVSQEEKETMLSIFRMMETELGARLDDFSQGVVISQIALLLNFADRFYHRQFLTQKVASHDITTQLEAHLQIYLNNDKNMGKGIPTVQSLAEVVHLSPSYLSDMLRSLTGRNAQQFIHDKLIDKAKELLTTTTLSISEIAFILGFEYSQSFSRMFKTQTDLSPLAFRKSFN
ncbi:MAG: AraC family transcriptional regulator [Cytophagaceae bacterium]|nr:AraC family transcriptional regulator [Cytophagaceae bacterium]|tara:strand:- start:25955 stop:26878 length:924 start_codon:yes stop_codon:yes gene_type:complete